MKREEPAVENEKKEKQKRPGQENENESAEELQAFGTPSALPPADPAEERLLARFQLMLDKQSEKFDRKLDTRLEIKLGEMADNISKVREELRDDLERLEQGMLAEVKEVRSDTFKHVQSEIERLEDLIKQLSADGGHSAPTKSTHQPVPGISNAAVVAAVQDCRPFRQAWSRA